MSVKLEPIEVIAVSGRREEAYTKASVHAFLDEIAGLMRQTLREFDGSRPLTIEDYTAPQSVGAPPKELEEGYPV